MIKGTYTLRWPIPLTNTELIPQPAAAIAATMPITRPCSSIPTAFENTVTMAAYSFKGLIVFIEAYKDKRIRLLSVILLLLETGWLLYMLYLPLFLVQTYDFSNAQLGNFMGYLGVIFGISLAVIIR